MGAPILEVLFVHARGVGFPRGWRWSVPNMTMKPSWSGHPQSGHPPVDNLRPVGVMSALGITPVHQFGVINPQVAPATVHIRTAYPNNFTINSKVFETEGGNLRPISHI
jgi:hypothetical protein